MCWAVIARHIAESTGNAFEFQAINRMTGGSINDAICMNGQSGTAYCRYFVKTNDAAMQDMFAAEAAGLQELYQANAIHVPQPVCYGNVAGRAYLVTEYIDFGIPGPQSSARLGEQLALMHQHRAERFGWYRDNTIGSTPQVNTRCDDWVEFYRTHRLGYQLQWAEQQGYTGSLQQKGAHLQVMLGTFFSGYQPQASLLHGDLWSGNSNFDQRGEPVIYDPAVYYGDRETDIAMTELFGGFDADFYSAYQAVWPLDAGYKVRKKLYQLYHVLNHANLFGGGYITQAEHLMEQLLADV